MSRVSQNPLSLVYMQKKQKRIEKDEEKEEDGYITGACMTLSLLPLPLMRSVHAPSPVVVDDDDAVVCWCRISLLDADLPQRDCRRLSAVAQRSQQQQQQQQPPASRERRAQQRNINNIVGNGWIDEENQWMPTAAAAETERPKDRAT